MRKWPVESYPPFMTTSFGPASPPNAPTGVLGLLDRYGALMDRVASAAQKAGSRPEKIIVVLVSKYGTLEQIRELIDHGHLDFGESRAQQLEQRSVQIAEWLTRLREVPARPGVQSAPDAVRWHMVGHLQRNKARKAMEHARLIHSVGSLRLAEEIQTVASKREDPVEVLVQVNVSDEQKKHGVAPPAVRHLIDQIDTMVNVSVRGLMCMAEDTVDVDVLRAKFTRCQELFEETKRLGGGGENFNILSMGMSNDFEIAIECGSNCIRIGSAIFQDEGRECSQDADTHT